MPQQNVFLGLPDIMNGIRLCPANSFWTLVDASGNTYNFKDLGLQVIGYTGAGMAPVINQTTPYALIGGSYYQRTVPGPRTLTLLCYIDADNLRGLQLLRKALESYIAPDTSTQQAAQIKLRYALTNYCGDVIGTVLEMACNYVSGLEGNVDNLNQERFPLQFIEYAPPSIKELATNTNLLAFQSLTGLSVTQRVLSRAVNGVWSVSTPAGGTNYAVLLYDQNDLLWFGSTSVGNTNIIRATNGTVFTLAYDASNTMYIGGTFTTITGNTPLGVNYIASYNGSNYIQVGATINNWVYSMCFGNTGLLYAVGAFTTPQAGVGKWTGSAWNTLTGGAGLGGGSAFAVVKGLDGNIYIGGAFTTADGATVNRIVKYDVTAGTFVAMGGGVTGGDIQTLAVGPDGRIYAGGNFTAAGGISAARIAVWNGVQWQPLGPGLNNTVQTIRFDKNNNLVAVGTFTALGNSAYAIPNGVAFWNGSVWLPIDMDGPASGNYAVAVSSTNVLSIAQNNVLNKAAGNTQINNQGTANAVPTFVFTGPGNLLSLINYTTGSAVYFNYTLLAGETATLVLDPTNLTFTSNFFGDVKSRILPGSNLATFNLKSGTDSINCLISGTTSGATSATLKYRNTHWHFDAGVA